ALQADSLPAEPPGKPGNLKDIGGIHFPISLLIKLRPDQKCLHQSHLVCYRPKCSSHLCIIITRVNISNLHILDITLDATSENSADVKIPITADITVKPTLLDEIIHLDLNLVLKFSVRVENDAKTGVSKVVMEECRNDQHSISLTVLGSLLNRVVNSMDNLVNEVLSLLMHYESSLVCNRNAPYSVAGGLSHGSRHPASLGNLVCGSHH
uniref:Lipid-binding serum glycoprotein N-terminal domain-containing protein n=1 Tax=Capra hircus TaxID=9925 RepID=A0A8C2NZS8_CAPHI